MHKKQTEKEFTQEQKQVLIQNLLDGSVNPKNEVVIYLLSEIRKAQKDRQLVMQNLSRLEESLKHQQMKMIGLEAIIENNAEKMFKIQSDSNNLPVDKSDKH